MSDVNTSSVYGAALEYIDRGYAVIPVHGLVDPEAGICTCGKDCGSNAGKHPVKQGWTAGPAMSAADAYATWEEDGPDWNVGIRTGEPSGIIALDTEADGMADLAELEREHGKLPETYTVRTGGGGLHHYFQVPDFPVKNSAKKIKPHIDIRGTGGMVVAAPSVSGKGQYQVIVDAPVVPMPAWLYELLRAPVAFDAGDVAVIEDLPAYADLPESEQERVQRYALAAIQGEAETYATAPPGAGNAALFQAACNILEIVQSPWNLITVDDAVRLLDRARERRAMSRPGGGQDAEEFQKTFMSARGKVIGQGRAMPPDRYAGVMFENPFPQAAQSAAGSAVVAGGEPAGFTERGSALDRLRSRLHTRSQLDLIEPPTPLIEGVIDKATMVVLAGQFGTFKTFTTIGWACSVATGTPWLGHPVVTSGPVLYVAAEGASGLKRRVLAWEKQTGVRVPDEALMVMDIPVNLTDNEQAAALRTIAVEMGAVMVVIDTMHRCMSGANENDPSEMGRITTVADALREAGKITTLYVHHTGHNGARSRGASSIEDDADCVWVTKLTGSDSRDPAKARVFEQRKTKDSPLLDMFFVRLDLIDGTDSGALILVDEAGVAIDNAVAGGDPFGPAERRQADLADIRLRAQAETNTNAGLLLNVFADVFAEHASGVTQATVKRVAKEMYADRQGWGGGSFNKTFERAWGRLLTRNTIEDIGGGRFIVIAANDRTDA